MVGGYFHEGGERIVGQTVSRAVQPIRLNTECGEMVRVNWLSWVGSGAVAHDGASQVFERPQQARLVPQPLWGHCIWLAAVLLLLDVAVRRLEWGRANRSRAPRQDVAPIRLPRRKRTSTTPRVRQTQQRNEDPPEDDDDPPQGPTSTGPRGGPRILQVAYWRLEIARTVALKMKTNEFSVVHCSTHTRWCRNARRWQTYGARVGFSGFDDDASGGDVGNRKCSHQYVEHVYG